MTLHPQVLALRQRLLAVRAAPLYTLSVAEARTADLDAIQAASGSPQPVGKVVDREIRGPAGALPIRIYQPAAATASTPVLVYFFGGGWTLGSLETSDGICRDLTNLAGCTTVAVGYRLAPEHKFPAALDDCYAAVCWLARHAGEYAADPQRIAVGGDSAGGNLAAAVSLLLRDRGGPSPRAQLLIYPNTDSRSASASMRENDDPAFFNRRSVAWYWSHYLPSPEAGDDPYASPLRATDLRGLPPALVITAEYDPLRDEGERYAQRLRGAGVPVDLSRYPGMIHGFFAMPGVLDAAARARAQSARFLRGRLC